MNVSFIEYCTDKSLYYYGARYYDPRVSLWLSVDPLAIYDPFENENFIDGKHNNGIYNSFNHGVYTYCYQNSVKLIDPNGKQSETNWQNLGAALNIDKATYQAAYNKQNYGYVGESTWNVLRDKADRSIPDAISINTGGEISYGGMYSRQKSYVFFLKGYDAGRLRIYDKPKFGIANKNISVFSGVEFIYYDGPEKYFGGESLLGTSTDYSLGAGGKIWGGEVTYSTATDKNKNKVQSGGVNVTAGVGTTIGASKGYTETKETWYSKLYNELIDYFSGD